MVQWTNETPGEGSLGQIDGTLANLTAISNQFRAIHSTASVGRYILGEDDWAGSASDTWRAEALTAISDLDPLREVFDNARAAIDTYRASVESIHSRAVDWKSQLDESSNRYFQQMFKQVPDDPTDAEDQRRDLNSARSDKEEAEEQLDALARERESADAAVTNALNTLLPTTWPAQKQAFVAAGLTDAESLSESSITDTMTDLAETLIAGKDHGTETKDALRGLLDAYGEDIAVMDRFYDSLGGAGVVQLVDRLGSDAQRGGDGTDDTLALAQALRSGLSVASSAWTTDYAEDFTDDMFTGGQTFWDDKSAAESIDYVPGRPGAISYLFSDPDGAPMGEALTVASATYIDDLERVNDDFPIWGVANEQSHGETLWRLENGNSSGLQSEDVAGRVFETLGRYPDAALEFLSPTDPSLTSSEREKLGADRVGYWYGERDWSQSDEFEGPMALWFGATLANQNPQDGSGFPEGTEQQALLSSKIIVELTGNKEFEAENLSEKATGSLAAAIAPNIGGFADYLRDLPDPEPENTVGATNNQLNGTNISQWIPQANSADIIKMLGIAGSQELGSDVLQQTALAYQGIYRDIAVTDVRLDDPEYQRTLTNAMERINLIQGVIDGSSSGTQVSAAERTDAQLKENRENFLNLVNLIPVPGLKTGAEALNQAGDFVIGEVISKTQSAWVESANSADAVIATMAVEEDQQQTMMSFRNSVLMYDLQRQGVAAEDFPFDAPPVWDGEDSTKADFIKDAAKWKSDFADDIEAADGDVTYYSEPEGLNTFYVFSQNTGENVSED
ncbi:MAG: hypothetical protein JWQ43_1684 [Glaciihabitans sp.]|nr:hypothetical protein [Glaciihabitans sp.]